MSDEQVRESMFGLKALQKQKYLRLHRDIESAGWLVKNEKSRLLNDCSSYANALALTPTELMRKEIHLRPIQTDFYKRFFDHLSNELPTPYFGRAQGLRHNVEYSLTGVQR